MRLSLPNQVKYALVATCKETDTVHFYVSDTGIGIPKEEQQEVFTSFKKLDHEVPGTGLDLTLSQTIIRSLRGKVGLESEVNKGSIFGFEVPLLMR
jgi:signal transduction histidine kinase